MKEVHLEMIPLANGIPVTENSEVIIINPDTSAIHLTFPHGCRPNAIQRDANHFSQHTLKIPKEQVIVHLESTILA